MGTVKGGPLRGPSDYWSARIVLRFLVMLAISSLKIPSN